MPTRTEIIKEIYNRFNEDERLSCSRAGQLEYLVTQHFIHEFTQKGASILEIGAGTGRYSISLAKEGFDVTAIELVDKNLNILKENSKGISNLSSFQGDATNLSKFPDNSFDITLCFGPLYHLYEEGEVNKAIDEAIRVTKSGGVIMFAFLSVYAIMNSNYLFNGFKNGYKENFDENFHVLHFKEQFFTGYDILEFEKLFENKKVSFIKTVGVDGCVESIERLGNCKMSDEDFDSVFKYQLLTSDTRELLGSNSHLLYICKKN